MKRVVSWVAVSSKPQLEKESPQEQTEQNAAVAEAIGGEIVAVLEVPGESREIISYEDACARLPAYAQLRTLLERRSVDVLVCRDLSRLGRTTALVAQVIAHCHEAGCAVYSRAAPPSSLDAKEQAASEGATLMSALEGALAQAEMIKLRRRHEFGMLGRVKRGKFPGKPPWGYVKSYAVDGSETYAVDAVAGPLLRHALLDLYLARGMSARAVVDELAVRGVPPPTGPAWNVAIVRDAIRRVWRYAGVVELNKKGKAGQRRQYYRGRGDWPPILSDAEAAAVEDEAKRRAGVRRAVHSKHLYSQVIWCAGCGQPMNYHDSRRIRAKDSPGTYDYYKCMGTTHAGLKMVSSLRADEALRAWLIAAQELDDPAALLPAVVNPTETALRDIMRIEAEIERVRDMQLRADDAYVSGAMDADRHARQVAKLDARLAALSGDIERARRSLVDVAAAGDRQGAMLRLVAEGVGWFDGIDRADHAAIAEANARLRRHFRLWAEGGRIVAVELLQ